MLKELTTTQLRKIIRQYNIHTTIKNYSKARKEDLITLIHSRIAYEDGKLIIKPNNHVIEVPVNVKAPRVKKPVVKPEKPEAKKTEVKKEVKPENLEAKKQAKEEAKALRKALRKERAKALANSY